MHEEKNDRRVFSFLRNSSCALSLALLPFSACGAPSLPLSCPPSFSPPRADSGPPSGLHFSGFDIIFSTLPAAAGCLCQLSTTTAPPPWPQAGDSLGGGRPPSLPFPSLPQAGIGMGKSAPSVPGWQDGWGWGVNVTAAGYGLPAPALLFLGTLFLVARTEPTWGGGGAEASGRAAVWGQWCQESGTRGPNCLHLVLFSN